MLRVLPRRLRLNFMLCLLEPFSAPSLPAGLTQRQGSWRESHKLLCNGGSSSGLSVGVASDAAPPHCTPGLAPGGISLQVFVSAEMGVLRGLSACPLVVIYSCFHLTHGSFTEPFSNNLILKWCNTREKGKARSSCMLKNESQ